MLDLGCGLGRHTFYLNQQGLKGVGSDIAPSGLVAAYSQLRAAGFSPLLVRHDATDLPFADGAFDALLTFNVIYHATLADLRRTLAEILRVVRPGGDFLITFVGRHDGLMDGLRADVARGVCREIEPFTFIYVAEIVDDRDLPHHYVDEAEIRDLLAAFEITLLRAVDTSFVDEDGIFHPNQHYLVHARRPV